MTALLAAFGILGLYSQMVSPVSPYAEPARRPDRAGRRGRLLAVHGHPLPDRAAPRPAKLAAIEASSTTAGRAVFFSGLAVMISIGGLFLLDDPLFRSMAVGTIAVVLVAVIGSLTFLPATLAILGDGVNRLRIPILGRERPEGSGLWASVVRAVMRRPGHLGRRSARGLLHRAGLAGAPAPHGPDRLLVVPRLARQRPGGQPAEREVADRVGPRARRRRHRAPTSRRPRPPSTSMTDGRPRDRRRQRAGRRRSWPPTARPRSSST